MKCLVVIDVQNEYVSPGRKFHIRSIEPSLEKARVMLGFARSQKWPIAHVQHLQDGDLFGRSNDTSKFIVGFAPSDGEVHAVKGNYSAFSSPAFVKFAADHADHEFIVIGYGTTMCCLATIVDGYHRGYRFALVEDACAAKATESRSEAAMHDHATAILAPFCRITRARDEAAADVRAVSA
jgi:ureidoacrylate peracid hydrolase